MIFIHGFGGCTTVLFTGFDEYGIHLLLIIVCFKYALFQVYTLRLELAYRLLLSIQDQEEHVKNWRPHIHIIGWAQGDMVEDHFRPLLELADTLRAGKGFTIATALVKVTLSLHFMNTL